MIKVKMKNGKLKAKVTDNKFYTIQQVPFIAAGCIREICDNPEDFEEIKKEVIDKLSRVKLDYEDEFKLITKE